jgi:signal transduction histidine kinase
VRIGILAISFFSLTAFGAGLLSPTENIRRISLLVPLAQAAVWGFGLLIMRGRFAVDGPLWDVADVWTRYVVGIPGALLASVGLIVQQRAFRRAGLARFGQDSLWAAVAFAWYGIIGQLFTRSSPLFPSTVINQELFLAFFGFPVQLLRAVAALSAAIFVVRFLRSFEVETQRRIAALQVARLEEAEQREQMRSELFRRVVAAQEAERQRIARELHDETGQALTALGLGLRGAAKTLRQDEDKAAHHLRQLEGMAAHALDELRRLIADLRPSHLDDLGLPAALRWFAGEVQERAPLDVIVEVSKDVCELPGTVSTALFRIAQEAMTNVLKHADAEHLWVRLYCRNGQMNLEVEDDGRGFDLARVESEQGTAWGLLGMEERATLCGGRLFLNTSPREGTLVRVTIPCQVQADGAEPEVEHEDTPVVS